MGEKIQMRSKMRLSLGDLILLYILIVGLIILAVYIRLAILSITHIDIALDFGEGPIAYESWLISQGKNIYSHYINTPNVVLIVPYPPLFQVLSAGLIKLGFHSLSATRLISIFSAISISLLMYIILIREFRVSKCMSMLGTIVVFSIPAIFSWSILGRVDMLGALFSLLALYYVLKEKIELSAFFMSLALFTKQSYISLPLVITIHYLRKKEYKTIILLCSILLLPHILALSLFPYYLENVVFANLFQRLNFEIFFRGLKILVRDYIIISVLAGYGSIILIKSKEFLPEDIKKKHQLVTYYFITSVIVTTGLYAKPGSSVNYFIEPVLLGSLLVLVFLHRIKPDYRIYYLALLLLLGNLLSFAFVDIQISENYQKILLTDYTPMYDYINTINGTILFEDPYLAFKTKKGPIVDIFLLTQLSKAGVWNESEIIYQIEKKRFSAIVTHSRIECYRYEKPESRYSKDVIDAIVKNYKFKILFLNQQLYYFYYFPDLDSKYN